MTLRNPLGIHSRPAGRIVKLLRRYESSVRISAYDYADFGNARDAFFLLSLAVTSPTDLRVRIEGPDANEVAAELEELLAYGLRAGDCYDWIDDCVTKLGITEGSLIAESLVQHSALSLRNWVEDLGPDESVAEGIIDRLQERLRRHLPDAAFGAFRRILSEHLKSHD